MTQWVVPPGPVADRLRIGLLGGSFDPAHDGHVYVSETALKRLNLDYVWWLVSPGNPLKRTSATLAQRLASAHTMARHPRLVVTDIEKSLGTRFTIDTVRALQRRFPQVAFTWLMGSDNLKEFHLWRQWQRLAVRLPIAVVQRPGSILASLNAPLTRRFGRTRASSSPPAIRILDGARNSESATRLRSLGVRALSMLNSSL